ncbi:MAG TPA: hypothetical protein VK459_02315 [Polyangiaceae bacterium]|nr:hypothetical protein [Polyangiaceae bacterium]
MHPSLVFRPGDSLRASRHVLDYATDRDDVAAHAAEHSHHPEGSAGSECYNCHMPYTSSALLKGIRSHRVDSPDIAKSIAIGMPNEFQIPLLGARGAAHCA